jgi:hypothetical protein
MAVIVRVDEGHCGAQWRESQPTRIRYGDEIFDGDDVVKCGHPGQWMSVVYGGKVYACQSHRFDLQGYARMK